MGDIFLKLLNMSITASWLILAVLCIRLLFRKIPKWITCLLWGVVAIRLIFPFSIESAFSLQPSAEPIKTSIIVEGDVVPYVPYVDSNLNVVEDTVNPLLAETFAYQETESVAPLQVFTGVAGSIWMCGMVVLLFFALVSMIKLRLCVREAVRYRKNIYICDAVKSPFILGVIKPRIYLSSSLNEEEMDYIIAHENAHLKRKDYLWKPFGYLLLCIYWFNPLCWIAYIMLCKDIELACDEKVIKDMSFGDKKEYSRVLLSCATQRHLILVCPLAFGEVGVRERVKSVLNYKKPAFWITVLAIVVCIIVAICFLTNPEREYQIRITIPAGSTEEIVYQEDFFYSDEEISPTGNKITISLGGGMGDTEVVLKPIEVKEENAYEPTYITPGIPVEMDVEKGAWFKIGVNMQNSTSEDIDVYVNVRNVEIRIASEDSSQSEENTVQDEVNAEEIQKELERVVSSVGLENAYPWNNTVNFKSDADVLIKMASDETGRFEIYGIMSAKYGTYGLLLNDWVGGEQNWNLEYVPWMYTGVQSDQPILEPDGNGKYTFAYVYQYDDGVPLWRECILDCGYDTGHMELISQDGAIEDSAVREDYYKVATSISASEVEKFALGIKEDVLSQDWASLSEKIVYPISIDGFTLNESSDFMELDFNGKLSQEFVNEISSESCREMFCNWQGIMMGSTGQIWLSSVDEGSGTWELKIIGINGILDLSEETATPVAGVTMVDTTKVSSIVVTNGNTGEKITLTAENLAYQDLLKLYWQLDFTAEYEENTRVGYQYTMKLLDADGNKLQSITPYKDGVTVDGIFFEYDNTGSDAVASLNLMEYLEFVCNPEQSLMGKSITEVPVNTLENVTMAMETYNSCEGDIEIANESGSEITTGEWYSLQRYDDGEWHRLDELIDGIWKEVEYHIPNGETAVFPTNWKTWYGELPPGEYRIVKDVYLHLDNRIATYYLAIEFEIN